jgi:hypothetical protein
VRLLAVYAVYGCSPGKYAIGANLLDLTSEVNVEFWSAMFTALGPIESWVGKPKDITGSQRELAELAVNEPRLLQWISIKCQVLLRFVHSAEFLTAENIRHWMKKKRD